MRFIVPGDFFLDLLIATGAVTWWSVTGRHRARATAHLLLTPYGSWSCCRKTQKN